MKNVAIASILTLPLIVPSIALAAGGTLYLAPPYGTHAIGDTFEVQVLADTGGAAINAAEAELSFDPSALAVDHLSINGSIFDSWPTVPVFSNTAGTVHFTGWAKKSYAGDRELLLSITFTALRNGVAEVRFTGGTMLASSGNESDIIASMRSSAFSIQPRQINPLIPTSTPPAAASTATNFTSSATVPPDAPVAQPSFTSYANSIPAGQPLVVQGMASPGQSVYIWVQKNTEPAVQTQLTTGEDGSFTLSTPPVDVGVYRVWALAQDSSGRQSSLSEKITIIARPTGVAAAASATLSFATDLFPYIALLAAAALAFAYVVRSHRSVSAISIDE